MIRKWNPGKRCSASPHLDLFLPAPPRLTIPAERLESVSQQFAFPVILPGFLHYFVKFLIFVLICFRMEKKKSNIRKVDCTESGADKLLFAPQIKARGQVTQERGQELLQVLTECLQMTQIFFKEMGFPQPLFPKQVVPF